MTFNVLMYHEFREQGDVDVLNPSTISVAQDYQDALPTVLFSYINNFKLQMEFLKSEGYHTLMLQEIKDFYEKGIQLPEKSVLLTFDDAFQSVHKYAYPILKELQFHAVSFVVLGWLSQEKKIFDTTVSLVMSKAELEEMKDVFEFANHTTNLHKRYSDGTTEMQRTSLQELKEDLVICGKYVNHPDIFAYPFGIFSSEDTKRLAEINIQYAFTTVPGVNTKSTPLLELHRDTVMLDCTLEEFKIIVERGTRR
ncbi:polysaccharide deacetylase family protein [Carnobacterium pleistocenium]|uniref:polysaccharide deacetylase family protein n=1 Tax=Carnobacterium pleistocenium TaxID=181073 RepID=UPI0005536D86|nr:polysaccharide deacetylase family protein [Carnobacterium pleistocenium]